MADQKFIVGYSAGETANYVIVEASSVTQYGEKEQFCWKISGEKGTLWMSASAFLYAFPAEMQVPSKQK
ncbi:MAG: hypothetical protein WB696_11845 [Chthoniobacterales bacterium]|jgi:hypothetical protein